MSLKQHDNNNFIKEKDEVEKYLTRIIQRYFDIEKTFTQESIEAIILESLTRFKQMVISESGFIFSLNQMTGNLILTAREFGIETAINKKTAFNKDFGQDANTICEGNDLRLYDEREPLEHVHELINIKELKDILESFGVPRDIHMHNNKSVLNILEYAGEQTQIDLILVEQLEKAIEEYVKNLQFHQEELDIIHNQYLSDLVLYIPRLNKLLQNAKDIISMASNWLQNSYNYTLDCLGKYKTLTYQQLQKYVTEDQIEMLIDFFKKPYALVEDGEILIKTDGNVSLFPVPDITIIDSINDTKRFFDNCSMVNNTDWVWDSDKKVITSGSNYSIHSMLISPEAYNNYTHRVVLKSTYPGYGRISVVLAYDEKTNTNLSLVLDAMDDNENKFTASIEYNLVYSSTILSKITLGNAKQWVYLKNGIPVLIKKVDNNIKIWLLFDEPHNWTTEADMNPTDDPIFNFDLTNYLELNVFTDKDNLFGYGNFLQEFATYEDIYFYGTHKEFHGHTNVIENKLMHYTLAKDMINQSVNNKIKLFFKYEDENDKTITMPLPFIFKDKYGSNVVIQGAYTDDGDIFIKSSITDSIPFYAEESYIYKNDTVIMCDSINKMKYQHIYEYLKTIGCEICTIDSVNKNNFVKKQLVAKQYYMIDGVRSFIDNKFYDKNLQELTYTNWAVGYPRPEEPYINAAIMNDGLWYNVSCADEVGYVAEYKIKRLTDCFNNPRVYYQVLGNKEVE